MKNILIIGSGGREHALAWKLKQSKKVGKIFIAPGNAGTALVGENVYIAATDFFALVEFAIKSKIDLTIVGPDDPLALGIVDFFKSKGLKIWGPTKAAAQLEWSKKFAKEVMEKAGVPTAKYKAFSNFKKALDYVKEQFQNVGNGLKPFPTKTPKTIVIKASGLALGKGVTVCQTLEQAESALRDAMQNKIFGEAGAEVVIEEFLIGPEFSVHCFCDGKNFKMFPASQDHKRAFDADQGPNTGGMGTVAPLPWVSDEIIQAIAETIIAPTLEYLKKIGTPFVGLLYPGIMLTNTGPKVIEFNARFGDPETQSYMRLLKTDLLDIIEASLEEKLSDVKIEWEEKFACCVVLASGGYPGKYEKNLPITGLEEAEKLKDIVIFHAGTKTSPRPSPHPPSLKLQRTGEGRVAEGREGLYTNGGRVLGITAMAGSLQSALTKAYDAIKLINFKGMQYRKDIGFKSLPNKK